PQVAATVCDVILAAEVQRGLCEVYAFVVMPDHVHLLLSPSKPMSQITQWIKGVSGLRANRLLGRTGKSFWQDESFDHWMRSNAEFEKTREYIEANPVRKGFVPVPELWPYSSAFRRSRAQEVAAKITG